MRHCASSSSSLRRGRLRGVFALSSTTPMDERLNWSRADGRHKQLTAAMMHFDLCMLLLT